MLSWQRADREHKHDLNSLKNSRKCDFMSTPCKHVAFLEKQGGKSNYIEEISHLLLKISFKIYRLVCRHS